MPTLKDLKSKALHLEPTIRVGKNGMTDSIVEEIICQLKKRKMVKIKMLKSFADGVEKEVFFKDLEKNTRAKIVHRVGFIVTLYKP